ncbi:MAG TPA: ArsC family reductase [Noviherbaspirillum sp.]|nr:ArsC family reductase [Noviherbaspirillum sp.]
MAITLYGIPNCDTVKKARTWLDNNGVEYRFHDFKKTGVSSELVAAWLQHVGWEILLNRKGTTWRALDDERKTAINDAASATLLMMESPSVIKRPVLFDGNAAHVGFSEALYQQIFTK